MEFAKLPEHIAFIMDGNGRWGEFLVAAQQTRFVACIGGTPTPAPTHQANVWWGMAAPRSAGGVAQQQGEMYGIC